MKVSVEETGQRQAVLNVEVEPDEVEKSLEKAYRRLVNRTNIPGFRKGKAPRATVERYLGKEALLDNALDDLVNDTYQRAIEEKGLDALGAPQVEILERDPVSYKATIWLRPIVELGDYHQLQYDKPQVEVTGKETDDAVEEIRLATAPWEPVEHGVDPNDLVTLDVEGTVDGESIVNQSSLQYQAVPESKNPAPGFAEQLIGMEPGEEKEFDLPFPEDYSRQEMAGKDAHFKVKVHEVKEKRLPELDDEFAKGLGERFDSLDALHKQVESDIRARKEREATRKIEDDALTAMVGMSQVEYPPVLEEQEIDRLVREHLRDLGEGDVKLADYLTRIGKTEEQFREELKPAAVRRLKRSLVLSKLADAEKIEVTPEEVDAEIDGMIQGAGESGDRLRRALRQSRDSIENMLLTRKTLQRLVDIATSGAEEEKTPVAEAEVPAES